MLLNMTSGIAGYTEDEQFLDMFFADPYRVWQPQELVDIALGLPPDFEPGTAYNYSNSNYVMLGLIIEDITGQDVRVMLHEQILDPLGLVHTRFPANDDTLIPEPFARGTAYGETGELQDATNWNFSWPWTAGQMISTQDDLHLWVRAMGTGELLSPETQAERLIMVPTVPDLRPGEGEWYGLGIRANAGWLGHGGSIPGYNSELRYRPDLDASLIVFANSDIPDLETFTSPANAVFFGITTILNREYPLPPAS
jgi:D-alanyl-D-alanine carboxypeptidase